MKTEPKTADLSIWGLILGNCVNGNLFKIVGIANLANLIIIKLTIFIESIYNISMGMFYKSM